MRICLVAAFPPSKRQLNEYSFHIAREILQHKEVELVVLADELEEYDFARDVEESVAKNARQRPELLGLKVIRCWKFGSMRTPMRLLNTIRRLNPDVVWFNLVFSSFGSPESPLAAFAGLSAPAITRAAGFYTHITLHHIIEHVDFSSANVRSEKLYRMGTNVATRALLKAHSVSVLLSDYQRTLAAKYAAENILIGTHGTFTKIPIPPDFAMRGNPEHLILAFGNWGTYKRLETLMEAFPSVLKKFPGARLVVAGGNHPAAAGYWESIRDAQPAGLPIEFRGYIPQEDVPELFRSSTMLVMPYDSSTGSSGPAHQACEYGVPIVCADIPDFRCMAVDDDMAISFYRIGDAADLADKVLSVLESPQLQQQMSLHNYEAGIQMSMATVARSYLRWFELNKVKRMLAGHIPGSRRNRIRALAARLRRSMSAWTLDDGLIGGPEIESSIAANSPALHQPRFLIEEPEGPGYDIDSEFEKAG
jgi:glycosyltransferase involved in cell wall biosynthesis